MTRYRIAALARCLPAALLLLCSLSPATAEEIYRIVRPDGSILYTDRPQPGAEPVETRLRNQYRAPATPIDAADDPSEGARIEAPTRDHQHDYRLEVLEPGPEGALRAPGGQFQLRVRVTPAPADDLFLTVHLGGETVAESIPAETETVVEGFSEVPGERTLEVLLTDADDQVLARSDPLRIHLLRRTLHQPAPANPAPNWNPAPGP